MNKQLTLSNEIVTINGRPVRKIWWCSKTGLVPIFAKLIQRVKKFSSTFRTLPKIYSGFGDSPAFLQSRWLNCMGRN
ncbi:Uncharacterized protein dnm_096770 [Desulfonema magnum]|uniref:Uncharacterized protein n=1 Tax=Desulfonema magnum TaxID=45655 RepID=A0A975BXH1_9BACT|nr:Uncharacterized protein dnm_096770 [Desulfonema magnum]